MQNQPTPNLFDEASPGSKEVKLHLPIRTHVQLHTFKLLRNRSIQDAVVSALAAYFVRHPMEPEAIGPLVAA